MLIDEGRSSDHDANGRSLPSASHCKGRIVLLTRRDLLRWGVGSAGAVFIGDGRNLALAAPVQQSAEWAFPLLGDLHIDRLDHHDFSWLAAEHPGDVSQVENYSRITRHLTPPLLNVVRQQIADSTTAIPFIVQLGDLVEGLCGSEELAIRQANDAIDLLKKTGFPCPFLCRSRRTTYGSPPLPSNTTCRL